MNEHHTVAATDDSGLQVSGDNSVTVLAEVRCSRPAFRRAGFLFTRGRQQVEVSRSSLPDWRRSHASLCEYYRRLLMMRGAWRVWFMQWPVQI